MKTVYFAIVFISFFVNGYSQQWKNLVFEGGGIRGIAYAGAIQVLEKNNRTDSIENIAGTSVGAIVASLVAVNYSADEIKKIMYDLKIQQFNDGRYIFVGGLNRLVKKYGYYRGNALENWIGELLAAKTGNEHISFKQLHELHLKNNNYKDVFITATNLSKQKLTIFSWQTYPDMEIKTAVRASFSIPIYFSAVVLDDDGKKIAHNRKNTSYDVFVDGGILANYPLNIFDTGNKVNNHTLGVKLERPEQITTEPSSIAQYNIVNFKTYVGALYNVILETLNRDSSNAHEPARTIYISTGNIQPKIRKISRQQKDMLYRNGIDGATLFFDTKQQHSFAH